MDEKLINKARSVAGIGSVLHAVWLSDLASMGAQDLVYIHRRRFGFLHTSCVRNPLSCLLFGAPSCRPSCCLNRSFVVLVLGCEGLGHTSGKSCALCPADCHCQLNISYGFRAAVVFFSAEGVLRVLPGSTTNVMDFGANSLINPKPARKALNPY